jgi:Xaa-Pro aminopeptidase
MTDRADRLQTRLADAGVDVLLVTNLVNVRWLTGFTGSNGLALVGPDRRIFVSDFRYVRQAADELTGFTFHQGSRDLNDAVAELLPAGPVRLGFEDQHVSVRRHRLLAELLGDRVELAAAGGLVEDLRTVKDEAELGRIRAAAALADAALQRTLEGGLVGRTEREVALALEDEMRRLGATGPSFESIVAAGPHGALPHANPRDVPIPPDQLVVIDWGALLDGYCSDCTRTVATGEGISDEAREVYELVRSAQATALAEVGPGRPARELDGAARELIAAAGHGEEFGHPLGHGVGIEVHEAPRLGQQNAEPVQPGNVVTVEPGVYLPERFGVRIEDLVAVTDDGHEVLSALPKDLTVIG